MVEVCQTDFQICCSQNEDKAKASSPSQLAASQHERSTDAILSWDDKWEWKLSFQSIRINL